MPELSRKQLVRRVQEGLIEVGYRRLSLRGPPPNALFYKWVNELVLTLGLEFSEFYEERFTASYFYGPTFEWAYALSDYPRRAYLRMGHLLTGKERERLLDSHYSEPGVVDAWWIGFTEESLSFFIEAVRLTEARMLAQENLEVEIHSSRLMAQHLEMVGETQRRAGEISTEPGDLVHQPRSYDKSVAPRYYWAAEGVLTRKKPELVGWRYTDLLARDAWRLEHLK